MSFRPSHNTSSIQPSMPMLSLVLTLQSFTLKKYNQKTYPRMAFAYGWLAYGKPRRKPGRVWPPRMTPRRTPRMACLSKKILKIFPMTFAYGWLAYGKPQRKPGRVWPSRMTLRVWLRVWLAYDFAYTKQKVFFLYKRLYYYFHYNSQWTLVN